ncbi:GDP-mannose 4,6-dehydratase [Tetrabaena socialis]|uniref:GDP-mannose 4,6-dehydratase n=1 Tax=Tetrabaena socialis TaxID=47790 RepID=A0A2J8AJ69_9CHLO|nr:GDP-mannose 4,6-dehydratase [Tetrabaena socialis]|eukprot:PNH12558.1 GDP-mannose 4,6-dehydratase [Tetrabaena socialis]
MTNHLQRMVSEIESQIVLNDDDIVVDIGSNDATLLSRYEKAPMKKLRKVGIDPSGTQFLEYYPSDVHLIPAFFDKEVFFAELGRTARAKVVTSISMFYDLPDPMGFVKDVHDILDDDGLWVMEQSYLPTMLLKNSYDTVCHEHLEYYCLHQIHWMCRRNSLRIIDVSFNDTNGGSFRVSICKTCSTLHPTNEATVDAVLKAEGLLTMEDFAEFATRCSTQRDALCEFIREQRQNNKTIAIYGASTKGNTLLQYSSIDAGMINLGVAERNPRKFGCRTPGTNIPIFSEEEVRAAQPDFMLVLPWHFKEEFVQRERDFLGQGGQLIFPLPSLELVRSGSRKTAVVLGANGQIGTHLVDFLLDRGYFVYGICRTGSTRAAHKFFISIQCDISRPGKLEIIMMSILPDEVYNLAAETDSNRSQQDGSATLHLNGTTVASVCDIVRKVDMEKERKMGKVKLFQANSTELYKGCCTNGAVGDIGEIDEDYIQFHPTTPYGVGKLTAYWVIRNNRELMDVQCSTGICCNIESRLRRDTFVTMKIIKHLQRIAKDYDAPLTEVLTIGNADVHRDWMHAKDAARAMHLILQQPEPGDYIISTGAVHSVKQFAQIAADVVGLGPSRWEGNELIGGNGNILIVSDESKYCRPYETHNTGKTVFRNSKLMGLGWAPSFTFEQMVADLCSSM